jgi:peptidoglycan-associated lipoprotein
MSERRSVVVALCLVMALAGACSSKNKGAGSGDDDGSSGLGEEGLGGSRGSSLSSVQRGGTPPEDGILKDVHFGYDSADVDSAERSRLEGNVEWLRDNPRAKVELEGHCDSRGTIEYNLGLGAKRAKSVKDYLVGQGIGGDRISTISYGKELPVCQDEADACWARNRRVHFVILGQ